MGQHHFKPRFWRVVHLFEATERPDTAFFSLGPKVADGQASGSFPQGGSQSGSSTSKPGAASSTGAGESTDSDSLLANYVVIWMCIYNTTITTIYVYIYYSRRHII